MPMLVIGPADAADPLDDHVLCADLHGATAARAAVELLGDGTDEPCLVALSGQAAKAGPGVRQSIEALHRLLSVGSRTMEEEPRPNRTGLLAAIIGAVGVLVVLAVLLDLGPFADEELSAAEFLAQGDEICAQAHEEFREVQTSAPRTAADAEEQVQALIDIAETELDGIADLGAPTGLEADVDEYLADRERGIELLRDGLEAARDDDPDAYEQAQAELASQQERRHEVARKLGFTECSKPLVGSDELESQAQPPAGG